MQLGVNKKLATKKGHTFGEAARILTVTEHGQDSKELLTKWTKTPAQ